ncbi:MAG TPA: ATPase domain-containing protein [Tepidisphaeraceae bacterium]|nr:ATPase domain-containing protein [Tepidisphaeraceae bacterium]
MAARETSLRISTGIAGLDDLLHGGLPPERLYLAQGHPGTGKTTLALQFLFEGARRGERVLFIALSETRDELATVAHSHGWTLEGIEVFELSTAQQNRPGEQNTLFLPSEVELNEITQVLLAEVDRVKPARVVIDSLSELRLLSQSPLRFRRQILALKQHFIGRSCTVLLLDDILSNTEEAQAHTVAHGVIELEQNAPEYGAERRRMRLVKVRGVKFRGGWHDYEIDRGGLRIFPRLVASEHKGDAKHTPFPSGLPGLDKLLGGGIDRGTSMLIMGPAGAGKSSISQQFAAAALDRGERAAIFMFDETVETMMTRSAGIGMNLRGAVEAGRLLVRQIDPAAMAPGEFTNLVRDAVENQHARVVIIDSLNGYLNAMPEERFLTIHMHELLTYLSQKGVLSILVMAQHGLMGRMESPLDVSYLSDSVLLLRYFESQGSIRQAISVMKKRTGAHERTIREFAITPEGLRVGEPLVDFHAVLTGVPTYTGKEMPMLREGDGG